MTGHGAGRAVSELGEVAVELSTGNRKQLDVVFQWPPGWQAFESVVVARIRKRLARGRVHATVRWSPASSATGVDEKALAAWLADLRAAGERLGLEDDLKLSQAARHFDAWRGEGDARVDPAVEALLLEAVDAALDACVSMRKREGEALVTELAEWLDGLEAPMARVKDAVPSLVGARAERLRQRLSDAGLDAASLDPGWEREIALLADRMDVREELVRIEHHIAALRELLGGEGEAGRKLDFLLQEVFREVNTLSVKCADAAVSRDVVDIKAALEKMREQAQNLE